MTARRTRRTRALAPAAALAVLLGLTACVSDDPTPEHASGELGRGELTDQGDDTVPDDAAAAEAERAAEYLAALDRTEVDVVSGDPDFPAAVGEPDAEVTMVLFNDYFCSYCQALANESLPQLQDLVDDGTLRIQFRDVAVLSEESGELARAAWAAGLQDGYAELHDSLMADPPAIEDVSTEVLTERAVAVGLDGDRFAEDLAAAATATAIEDNLALAQQIELQGTPTAVLEGYVLVGFRPAEDLRLAIAGVQAEG